MKLAAKIGFTLLLLPALAMAQDGYDDIVAANRAIAHGHYGQAKVYLKYAEQGDYGFC